MAVVTTRTPTRRLIGPDVVRAVAMAGVVIMNFHGYLGLRGGRSDGGWLYDLFDTQTGPLATRFAATFVLTAGVGVTLMTRSAVGDPARTADLRWRLARRGLLLYGFGMAFDFIWPGTILPYYGALFVLAAGMFTLRSRWVDRDRRRRRTRGMARPGGGGTSARSTATTRVAHQSRPEVAAWGCVIDVFVNGTHPLLPWLAFFCAGIVLGRLLVASGGRPPRSAPASSCSRSPRWSTRRPPPNAS